jgi:pantothenate synthetase
LAKKQFGEGKKLKDIKKNIEKNILSIPESKIDYIELRNSENLDLATDKDNSIVIAVAVKVSNVRLIDNIVCKK